jgi:ArsR family transcriptional regulator
MNTAMKNSTITMISTMNKSTIPPDGFAIADLEHGGWRNIAMQDADGNTHRMTLDTSWKNVIALVKMLSDKTRVAFLLLVEAQERAVEEIQTELDRLLPENAHHTQPNVSHHKRLLLQTGLIDERQDARERPSRATQRCVSIMESCRTMLLNAEILTAPVLSIEKRTATSAHLSLAENFVRSFNDKLRIFILSLLYEKERAVNELCNEISISQPGISHHIAILVEPSLIKGRKEGKRTYYSLTEKGKIVIKTLQAWR